MRSEQEIMDEIRRLKVEQDNGNYTFSARMWALIWAIGPDDPEKFLKNI